MTMNEIHLYGSVGASWWDEDYFTAKSVREMLAGRSGPLTVRINSGGGVATEGQAIYTMLKDYDGEVAVVIDGVAASAASLIAMAGDSVTMRLGAWMLIHDPATPYTLGRGTEADHMQVASQLKAISAAYAGVYAQRTGMSKDDARAIMRAEVVYEGEAAVEAGFATAFDVDTPAAAIAAYDYRIYATAPQSAREGSETLGASLSKAAVMAMIAGKPRHKEPIMAKVETISPEVPVVEVTTEAPPVVPVVADPSEAIAAATADARRLSGRILEATAVAGLPISMAQDLIARNVTLETALDHISAEWKKGGDVDKPMTGRADARITRDEVDTKVEGMITALMGRSDGPAEPYRGMRVKALAMHLSGERGFNEAENARRGMVSTALMGGAVGVSDFAFITTSVFGRTLRAEYDRRAGVWQTVSAAPMSAPDFRELVSVRFGGDFSLKKVLENGEYQVATLADESEGLRVERRGRTIALTFEAVINDDMGALLRIPQEFAIAARIMENSMVWSLIRGNAVVKSDGLPLFHATHKNLGTGAALTLASFQLGRKAMWEQRAFGVKDPDDFAAIEPNILIVPPALEGVALQFVTSTTPATDGTTNPYKSSIRPVVVPNIGAAAGPTGSDTAWYMISSDYPPVSVAYLDGYAAPTVQTVEGMNPDLVTINARHIFGAANTEFRGAYRNPGL